MWAGVLLALYTVVGFFVLPPVARSQIQKRASATLGRRVTVEKVRLNPYALSATLLRFDVREADGTTSFLGWDRLYVRVGLLSSLFGGNWTFPAIRLDNPHVRVVVNRDGSLNLSDILTRFGIDVSAAAAGAPAPAPAVASRPLRIGLLAVAGATLDFTDQSRSAPFHTVVGPQVFNLTDFRTAGGREAPYRFTASTESGEQFAWQGWIEAAPFRSAGEVSLQNIILKKYAPYYADRLRGELTDGKLDVRFRYELSLDAARQIMQAADGTMRVRDLRLVDAGGQPVAELPSFEINGFSADALARRAAAGTVTLTGAHLAVRREQDGSINLLKLLPPAAKEAAGNPAAPAAGAPAAPAAAATALPQLTVGQIELKDFGVDIADLSTPRPAALKLSGGHFALKEFTTAPGATMPLAVSFGWAPAGTVVVNGTVGLLPAPTADLKAEIADFALPPLSPYLEQGVNARLVDGAVTAAGHLQIAPGETLPAITLTGDASVAKLGLVDGIRQEALAGFNKLGLAGLQAGTAPRLTLTLAEVTVDGPYARVIRLPDGAINLAGLARQGAAAPGPAAAPAAAEANAPAAGSAPAGTGAAPASAAAPEVAVEKVTITGGDFSFVDRAIEPNVRMELSGMAGTIMGLSSSNPTRGDVEMTGVVDGVGRISVTGKLDPLGPHKAVSLVTAVKGVDLVPFSPYCGKYAGYELARGKLLVDVNLKMADQRVDSSNVLTLQQFTFGAPTNSPDATHLPVRLGVALLKDLDGKIVLDVPVAGDVNDPSFRIGKVVMRVIVNLLTKAAVSPFKLLGSMFGGGGDELAWQEFNPGTVELKPGEEAKLGTLVKALTNRPGLSLDIEGNYDAGADTAALQHQKLAELVRRRIWEARHAANPAEPPPAQMVITPEEHDGMLRTIYSEKYPPGSELGVPVVVPPPAPPPPPKRGFIRRVVDAFTGRGAPAAPPPPPPKPEVPAGAAPAGPTLEEMTARLAGTMTVDPNDLLALAAARANSVRDYFIQTGKIASERLFLARSQTPAPGATAPAPNKGPRVFLTLE